VIYRNENSANQKQFGGDPLFFVLVKAGIIMNLDETHEGWATNYIIGAAY